MDIEYKEFLAREDLKDGYEFLKYITIWAKEYLCGLKAKPLKSHAVNRGPANTLASMPFPFILASEYLSQGMTTIMVDRVHQAFIYLRWESSLAS